MIPSLRQKTAIHYYRDQTDDNKLIEINPEEDLDIMQDVRAVKIPDSIIKAKNLDKIITKVDPKLVAKESLKSGTEALSGVDSAMSDCIRYGSAIILSHITKNNIKLCSKEIKKVLKSGSALKRLKR